MVEQPVPTAEAESRVASSAACAALDFLIFRFLVDGFTFYLPCFFSKAG
jgi:hypothetical protein